MGCAARRLTFSGTTSLSSARTRSAPARGRDTASHSLTLHGTAPDEISRNLCSLLPKRPQPAERPRLCASARAARSRPPPAARRARGDARADEGLKRFLAVR